MEYNALDADIAIIGAGHAGIEAALASARLGCKTVLFTINLDAVGNMPCNPSIGGCGKSHLVYEIDALGGEMGFSADKVTLQSRTLNGSRGPAVHSKRIQADRLLYREIMKRATAEQENLILVQAEVVDIRYRNGQVSSVVTANGAVYGVKAAIICTGTFLSGRVVIGENTHRAGPDGMLPAYGLSESLRGSGIQLLRFKTGTPPRVHKNSIDFSKLELQPGEYPVRPFSMRTDAARLTDSRQLPCHIAYTNSETHRIIRENLHRSPLYTGIIEGTGPRYCPSIEDKIVRFADKNRHQLFVEPMGRNEYEMYIQGFSSSLPEEVQLEALHSISGFENAQVMRSAYAIEYDCINPINLYPTLEFKAIQGLYGAGQFNGTSGYEEAAAQGLIAGINAALKIKGREPLILTRDSSYIGTLIDDLVTKGTKEPYRIMTSRSEYRLLLRQDNAAERLGATGYKIGLLPAERYEKIKAGLCEIEQETARAKETVIPPSEEVNACLAACGSVGIKTGVRLCELIKRPELDYKNLAVIDASRPQLSPETVEGAEIRLKYDGYINRQLAEAQRAHKLEGKKIPPDIDYTSIGGIRTEAVQKLTLVRPENIGQASRISGVSPADISVLLIYLK